MTKTTIESKCNNEYESAKIRKTNDDYESETERNYNPMETFIMMNMRN